MLRALGLGDLLAGVPALRALAVAFPEHRRVLAAPAVLAPLARLSGAVEEVWDTRPLAPLPPVAARAAVAVNLHGRGPESHRVLLAAAPERLVAFRHPDVPETARAPAWRADEHEAARWCRLLEASGMPADPARLELPAPEGAPPPGTAGATVVHPGAASPARRWPPERWATVARAERRRGRRVVVTGGAEERALARDVARLAGLAPEAVLAGRTDLLGLARTVAVARVVLCGDTGVAHLATALGTPSVVLFGPTDPAHWGPPPSPRHRVLWAGRRGDPHGPEPDPGLLRITPADVRAALDALEGDPAAAPRARRGRAADAVRAAPTAGP